MHRLAEALNRLGREAKIIQEEEAFHPGWFKSNVNTISYAQFKLCSEISPKKDIIVLPETFLPIIDKYAAGIPKIIFNQNGAYSFGLQKGDGFPEPEKVLKLYKHSAIKHVLCISKHDEMMLKEGFDIEKRKVSRIINGIEVNLFKPGARKKRVIAYMPRKNSKDSGIVAACLKQQKWFKNEGWSMRPIDGLPQEQVAKVLQESLVFLAFGHPEGFGLPIAEAAACGCYVIGYSGLGGGELLRILSEHSSGLEIAYGDWLGFIAGCKELSKIVNYNPAKLAENLLKGSKTIRSIYNPKEMINSVGRALDSWEAQ